MSNMCPLDTIQEGKTPPPALPLCGKVSLQTQICGLRHDYREKEAMLFVLTSLTREDESAHLAICF